MRKLLGEVLVERGLVPAPVVQAALQRQSGGDRRRLGELLVSGGALTPRQLTEALAAQFELPITRLESVDPRVAALVPLDFQATHRVILFGTEPEGKGERLQVAVEDPSQFDLVEELRFQMQRSVSVFVAAREDVDRAYTQLEAGGTPALEVEEVDDVEEPEFVEEDEGGMPVVGGELMAEEGAGVEVDLPAEWADPTPRAPAPALAAVEPVDLDWMEAPPPPAAPAPTAAATLQRQARAAATPPARAAAAVPLATSQLPLAPTPPGGVPAVQAATSVLASAVGGAPPATADAAAGGRLELSEDDLKVLDSIDRLAAGADEDQEVEKVRPARMVASLVRLLMKKGVIHELEFLEELSRK